MDTDGHRLRGKAPKAFTLIELLTVIAIIGILASLLLTALTSARKKSRTTVCTFNLHQISLALNMYLDESGQRPGVEDLVGNKFLPAARSLLCPEDKTGNWGRLVQETGGVFTGAPLDPASTNLLETIKYSYLLHPLYWDEAMWKRLLRSGSSAGIAACQLHGLGSQEHPDVHNFSGLLLRGQRDGAVVRRKIFWTAVDPSVTVGAGSMDSTSPSGFVPNGEARGADSLYPLQIFLDDPAGWLQNNP
jgi:prepilin-type N-terminal cleavage/methylation domain-containing protein